MRRESRIFIFSTDPDALKSAALELLILAGVRSSVPEIDPNKNRKHPALVLGSLRLLERSG
jgi:hypothetical protein